MASNPDRLRITVSDAETGEELDSKVIYDDYVLICAGSAHLAHTQAHANGTHVLTVKGRRGA